MKTMCFEMLARKGEVTILERAGGKTTVALKVAGGVVTLQGNAPRDQLLAELFEICRNYPDT